jgi:hypothetical protein
VAGRGGEHGGGGAVSKVDGAGGRGWELVAKADVLVVMGWPAMRKEKCWENLT